MTAGGGTVLQTYDFPRFGACAVPDADMLEFPWGLPGFPALRRFVALQVAGQEGFVWLQSLEDPSVALPMTDPWSLFDDYAPKLPYYAKEALELEHPEDFVIYCVLVVPKDAADMTINLLAPIVINLKTRVARQVMLDNSGYSVKTPVPRKAPSPDGEEAVLG